MKLFDKEFKDWIDGHRNDDVASLRLRFASADAEVKEAISQIEYRSKAGDKFRTLLMDKDFAPQWFPTGLSVEQASSAAVAAFHASLMSGAGSVLDMTMGLGVDAAAVAVIDGAEVTAVERDTRLCDFARENYKAIGNLTIVNADSVEYLNDTPQSFDWIFIDPARRDDVGRRVFNIHDCTPDVSEIMPLMFSHAPNVLVKLSPMLDVSATISELGKVAKLYIVEERGEVREVLVHLDRNTISEPDTTPIEIVSGDNHFIFTRAEEAGATERYTEPVADYYLYEPSPAVMKAGPFKLLCEKFDVGALHSNTHLYVSPHKIDGFPGRRYIIQAVISYASKNIKRFARDYPAASVSVRNFPCTAAALRAKLKVKESDAVKVVGATLKGGNQVLIVMSRV